MGSFPGIDGGVFCNEWYRSGLPTPGKFEVAGEEPSEGAREKGEARRSGWAVAVTVELGIGNEVCFAMFLPINKK